MKARSFRRNYPHVYHNLIFLLCTINLGHTYYLISPKRTLYVARIFTIWEHLDSIRPVLNCKMVEPISIAHGLAAFVEMCIRVYGMIKDAHRASDELTSLGEGLESFSQFYQKIEQEIQTCATFNSLEGEQITHILKEAKKELMLIDEYVNKKWKYRNSTIRKIVTGGDTLRDTRVYRDKISGHVLQLNNVRSM